MLSNHSRRAFLKNLSVATAGTLLVPHFLQAGQASFSITGRRLVVIQLSGGNDGLNTIVPFRNDILYKSRPGIGLSAPGLLRVTDEVGFHPSMNGFRELYDAGELCILNSVGYPNPNRSHFRSMDIWHSASDSDQYWNTGWLGRYIDSECPSDIPVTGIEMSDILSLALKGDEHKGLSMSDVSQFHRLARAVHEYEEVSVGNPTASFLYKTIGDIKSSSTYLNEKKKARPSTYTYPQNELAQQLREVAGMVGAGVQAPIFYTSLGGFDTHNAQKNRQARLLSSYSESVKAFAEDLKQMGEWDNTLILTFSEFGRRVKENGSGGTDHGQANNLFLMGGKLKKPGIFNDLPDLADLSKGDIKYQIDFRQVYASILEGWMEADAQKVLGASFKKLGIV